MLRDRCAGGEQHDCRRGNSGARKPTSQDATKVFRIIPKMLHVKHFCPVEAQNPTKALTSGELWMCRIAQNLCVAKTLANCCFRSSVAKVAAKLLPVPMPTPPDALEALKAAIASGKALLICGAGVSRSVTQGAAPGWKDLIKSAFDEASRVSGKDLSGLYQSMLADNDINVWLNAANIAQEKLVGCKAGTYRTWLKNSVGNLKTNEPALLDAIKALNCRLATTNYDGLLCDHMGAQPKTWRNPDSVAEILTGEPTQSRIWHIHGGD
jgi:hypothetical protein